MACLECHFGRQFFKESEIEKMQFLVKMIDKIRKNCLGWKVNHVGELVRPEQIREGIVVNPLEEFNVL